MKTIVMALVATAQKEVLVEGLEWRIELPDPEQLSVQARISLAAQVRQVIEPVGAAEHSQKQLEKVMDKLRKDTSALQELEARTLRIYRDWLCASVRAVRQPGGQWEDLLVVAELARESETENRLWVGRLGPATVMQLGTALAELAKEDCGSRVGRFLGRDVAPV